MSGTVLKPRHSLIGKSVVPAVVNLRALDKDISVEEMARLKKDHCLTSYSIEDLEKHFSGITGESAREILPLAGITLPPRAADLRHLLHFTILHANLVGGPKATPLREANGTDVPGTSRDSERSSNIGTSKDTDRPSTTPTTTSDVEQRLKTMEDKVNIFTSNSSGKEVEECLKTVRTLAHKPGLTFPHVLMSAIETLVQTSVRLSHNDAEYFGKAYTHCKKFENSQDLCSLVLKLFGTPEDKKIANVVTDWLRGKKAETVIQETKVGKDNKTDTNSVALNAAMNPYMHSLPGPAYQMHPRFPPYHGFQGYHPYPFPAQRGNFQGRGLRGRRGRCNFCKEQGHYVAECPKIKKE